MFLQTQCWLGYGTFVIPCWGGFPLLPPFSLPPSPPPPVTASTLLAGLLKMLSSPPASGAQRSKSVLLPTDMQGQDPYSLCFLCIGMWLPLGFIFKRQTLRLEVRGKERCSSMRRPGAARAISVRPFRLPPCPHRAERKGHLPGEWSGGRDVIVQRLVPLHDSTAGPVERWLEKSLNGKLWCGTWFLWQKSGQSRLWQRMLKLWWTHVSQSLLPAWALSSNHNRHAICQQVQKGSLLERHRV